MAGSFSDYSENELLDHLFSKGAYTMPSVWVGLFTVAPTDAGGGTEVSGGSYVRKSTAAGDWNVAASGSMSNANDITFVTATASWGTVIAWATFDAASAGNMLVWADLTENKTIGTGDIAKFTGGTPGALVATLD